MMLTISTTDGGAWFKPGETVTGTVFWQLDEEAEAVEVRLFWFTEGKGTRDVDVVDRRHLAQPGLSGTRPFRRTPFSFGSRQQWFRYPACTPYQFS